MRFKDDETGESALHKQHCEAETGWSAWTPFERLSGSNVWLLLEGKFERRKQEKGLEGRGLMACC